MEAEDVSLPSFEGIAKDGDLAGNGLSDQAEKKDEFFHGLAAKVWMYPRSVETMSRPSDGVRP